MEGESISLPRKLSFVGLEWCLGEVAFLNVLVVGPTQLKWYFPDIVCHIVLNRMPKPLSELMDR